MGCAGTTTGSCGRGRGRCCSGRTRGGSGIGSAGNAEPRQNVFLLNRNVVAYSLGTDSLEARTVGITSPARERRVLLS